jgi:cytoskeletal protein RodZ
MFEIGSSLREARRRRHLELAEVERATRIRAAQLEALEHERFELLPPDPYRRAFLREYADYLGLDSDLYTSEYDLRFRPPAEPPAVPPRQRPRLGSGWLRSGRPLLRVGVALVVVLVGVVAWQFGRPAPTGTPTPTPPPPTHAQTGTRPRIHTAAKTPSAKRATPTLVLTAARGRCWLWVRLGSATGQTVYEQTLQQGQRVRFGLHQPLWVRIGAPWNLDATLNRRTITLPAHTADVLATATAIRPAP